jgi:hypothetical protein
LLLILYFDKETVPGTPLNIHLAFLLFNISYNNSFYSMVQGRTGPILKEFCWLIV